MAIGAAFPEDLRRQNALERITPGRVVRLWCDFTDPAKEKLVVLAALGDALLLFAINSKIAEFIKATPHHLACQITVTVADHTFLDHDSFLDCVNVYSMTRQEIMGQLVADPSRIKGEVSAQVKGEIIRVVRQAKSISNIHKGRIIDALA